MNTTQNSSSSSSKFVGIYLPFLFLHIFCSFSYVLGDKLLRFGGLMLLAKYR